MTGTPRTVLAMSYRLARFGAVAILALLSGLAETRAQTSGIPVPGTLGK